MKNRVWTWRRTVAGVAAANVLPLVGIVLLDWGLTHLLIVYWVEITVGGLRRTLEATFAGRHGAVEDWAAADSRWGWRVPFRTLREKRGGVRLHAALPPTYPRSFPRVFDIGRVVVGLSLFSGVGIWVATAGQEVFVVSLLVAGVTTLAREGTTLADDLRSRDYEALVPHSILTPRSVLGVVALAVVVVWSVALAPSPTASVGFVLASIYLVRVGFDVYSLLGRGERFDPLDPHETDFETAPDDERHPVAVPDVEPTTVFDTNRRAVWVSAVADGLLGILNPRRFAAVAVAVCLGYVVNGVGWAAVAGVAVVVAFVGYTLLERDLRWGHVEYRVYENSVICYDGLLAEPQWRIDRTQISETASRSEPLGRLLGVSSVALERYDDAGTETLRYLDTADTFVAELARRPAST